MKYSPRGRNKIGIVKVRWFLYFYNFTVLNCTLLFSATSPEVVQLLLEHGADPAARDVRGKDVVQTLLDTAPDSLWTLLDHFINRAQAALGADNLEGEPATVKEKYGNHLHQIGLILTWIRHFLVWIQIQPHLNRHFWALFLHELK